MIGLRGSLSKSSRDALAAHEDAKVLKPVIVPRNGMSPPTSPSSDKDIDAEVAALLATSPKLRDPAWHMWNSDDLRVREPSPRPLSSPLTPKKLEALAARNSVSKQKHVHRIQEALQEKQRPLLRTPEHRDAHSSRRRLRSPSPPSSPLERARSPMTVSERSALGHAYELNTSARTIYVLERKAFGREPITNEAASLRCAGTPTSSAPSSSLHHLEKVRSTLPALASAVQADYFDPPRPSTGIKKIAPKLSDFFEELHNESSDIWAQRSTHNLAVPAKSSGMYSPVASFHGIRLRAPHVKSLSV